MHWFFTARTFFVLCALFIFYATTIPWDFAHAPTLEKVAWVPLWDTARGRLWSIPDMVQNVVLFLPFGFFGYLGLPFLKRRGPVLGTLLTALLGLSLSLFVESLQTMSAFRSPSATDLVTNFAGAGAGALAAGVYVVWLQARFRALLQATLRTNPGLLIFAVYLVAVVAGSLAPFIPTLDIGLLRANVRSFLDNPWGVKPVGALLTDGALFGALAYLCAVEVPTLRRARPALLSAAFAAVAIGGLAFVLEGAQLVIVGHSPGVQDAVVGAGCAVLAGLLVVALHRGEVTRANALGELTRRRPWLVLGFAVLAPTLRALQPFDFVGFGAGLEEIDSWQFVPFWALFRNLNLSTFRNVFEASAIYLPLGYALFALGRRPAFGFFVCLGLAELLEILQIPVANRVFDVTEGVYAGLMGVAGAWLYTSLQALTPRAPEPAAPAGPPAFSIEDAATIPMQGLPPQFRGR